MFLLSQAREGLRSYSRIACQLPTHIPRARRRHHYHSMAHQTPSAFAEATGGAIGALWTTLLFHPLDVAKLRLQAEADAEEEESMRDDEEEEEREMEEGKADERLPMVMEQGDASASGSKIGTTPPAGATKNGPKTFLGEAMVVLKQPDLWYAGLGTSG